MIYEKNFFGLERIKKKIVEIDILKSFCVSAVNL